ncbi:MAG TPA: protein kinase, partial [Allocoleopsis sp.]
WNIGHTIKNRPYRIEKKLGEGGFGITYLAKNLSFNLQDLYVVIKTPNARLQRDINYPKYLQIFNKEANIFAQVSQQNNPNIVRVVDLFNEDNLPCLVMDYVKGKNLYDLVNSQGKLSEQKAIKYLKQAGSALSLLSLKNVQIYHKII